MPTSRGVFLALPLEQQVSLARTEGTFLGWRWETDDVIVGLYHLPDGFFCEIHLSLSAVVVSGLYTSTEPTNLADYTDDVELDELFS